MIDNDINNLTQPFRDKIRVFLAVVKIYKKNVAIFEWLRTKERQKRLVANWKSWTMNSYHLEGKAVDLVFLNNKKQPTWVWDYKFLHYLWFFCWITPIYNAKLQLIESCHLQDDWKTIKQVMKSNSESRHKAKTKKEQELLAQVNHGFRILWYK